MNNTFTIFEIAAMKMLWAILCTANSFYIVILEIAI